MSDRILVMEHGRIAQEGSPEEVYRRPATAYVADFVGQCNLLDGVIGGAGERCLTVTSQDLRFEIAADGAGFTNGDAVTLAIRPENIQLAAGKPAGGANAFQGRVETTSFFGDHFRSEVAVGSVRFTILSRSRPSASEMVVTIDPADIVVLGQMRSAP